ncbi:ethanolamine ammonia-lyase [Mycobacterium sp. MHSD3]|jgi:ethanolamine ammonia-lyase small subunit|uniref:ethanolamine ammonia-lyase subunit EutC n=1 Tax=Mycobacteroides chelonae TaxID=1774 RepID=UPI0009CC4A48|nr:ethanolamine ammonia-lyase subunit EutC [Mycobacteroides chelonae]MBF9521820.1 ethanolamine ammonia-lyase subunit EutC [Mycobacteroides chelonae]PKQ58640.1 ethanolamine ammonia-lyase [Mycobacterium sp. MHSD3]SKL82978.1 Probable ethanolamine ammonia-lyase, light subunit [Mycobacteroides abscessus subsp. bolletii]
MTTGDVARQKFWKELRGNTQARIGLDRAGNALHTRDVLDLAAAHAAARDAVHVPLDTERLTAEVGGIGLGTPMVVTSQVSSRAEYLRRPDLGRLPADLSSVPREGADIGFVLADGLSPTALMRHGVPLLCELVLQLGVSYSLAAPVIATQSRVALGDHIAAQGRYRTLIVIIGERPGLSVVDSLGIYLTHLPRPGCTDADRNCISNIHPPDGLSYREAAHIAASLVGGARRLGRSGVSLKDTSRAGVIDGAGQGELG